jgi:hypothetical protein
MGSSRFQTVYGIPSATQAVAREKAAQEAITRIIASGNIIIDDVNYGSLHNTLGQLHSATMQSYYSGVQAVQLAQERDRLSQEKDVILSHLAHICTIFDDVLPIEVVQSSTSDVLLSAGTLRYIGSVPPVTRVERVASFIIDRLLGPDHVNLRPNGSF